MKSKEVDSFCEQIMNDDFHISNFHKFQNRIKTEIISIRTKIEELNKKIDKQHLENINSDEILLLNLRNSTKQ
ncbi:hypothetical protein BKP45_07320 [Anaerobacillus alkalidiazotrophicus]|uniref:Uncharacterized protein n=1 Tax=Anaerobacillus alkalidiazotrophicus TaxID=472963 RepID=A0A1S2M8R6_9BACI|nr:hypothetical protein BKP45_07320 [Anaerobacillus alkalidiazotrophicus]